MQEVFDLTHEWVGLLCLTIFLIGYYFISREERYKLNKANPALFIGTVMFMIICLYFGLNELDTLPLKLETQKLILEISELFFFLLVAMTFIEVLIDRRVFCVLKKALVVRGYSYKELFWIVGLFTFFLSPIADNLTTALIFSTLIITLSRKGSFLIPSAISIVVAANAGGVWSPFGDITTLMAWTSGKGDILDFTLLFPAAFIGWFVTAFCLSFSVCDGRPSILNKDLSVKMLPGGKPVIWLGLSTIFISVLSHHFFDIPAMWGMMLGLALLQLYAYSLEQEDSEHAFNIYKNIKKTQMDTLLFFFGILSAVGALDFLGYLKYITGFYDYFGMFLGNILVGFSSAFVDNIPVMSAVLKSDLQTGLDGWLFLTLTVGIGGSIVSFGSAAGIGVMGKLKGIYTLATHFRFFHFIFLGYLVSIMVWYIQFELLGWY